MRVLVLLGGDSPEREVSKRSARSVIQALIELGLDYSEYDPAEGFKGLKNACRGIDLVLPILHGKNGEDGVVQDQLEEIGIKYLGANSEVSRVTIDKVKTHEVLENVGIKMPKYEVVTRESFKNSVLSKAPFVLKPINGGSSIDTLIARTITDNNLNKADKSLQRYDKMLLEELIEGIEISAPVLGEDPLPLIQIVTPEGEEFDYKHKYDGSTQEICPVPKTTLSKDMQSEIQSIILKAHQTLGVVHLSRSEFIVKKDGSVYMLELNTIPGLTDQSLYPKSAKVYGINMAGLVEKLIEMVLKG